MNRYSICPVCKVNKLGMDNNGVVRRKCLSCSYANKCLEERALKPKISQEAICLECKQPFTKWQNFQKYCNESCTEKSKIRKQNEKWLGTEYKEPEAKDPSLNDKIIRSNLYRKKPKWLKKYEHCRG